MKEKKLTRKEVKEYKLLLKNKEWLKKAIEHTAEKIVDYPQSLIWK